MTERNFVRTSPIRTRVWSWFTVCAIAVIACPRASFGQSGSGGGDMLTIGGARGSAWSFLRIPVDARGVALGAGYVAFVEGTGSLYWNPAGMIFSDDGLGVGDQRQNNRIQNFGVTGMALRSTGIETNDSNANLVSAGPNQYYIAVVRPQQLLGDAAAIGASFEGLTLGSVFETDENGGFLGAAASYHDWSASLATAFSLATAGVENDQGGVSAGVAIRLAGGTYSRPATGFDGGMLWRMKTFPLLGEARIGYSIGVLLPSQGNDMVIRWRWGLGLDRGVGAIQLRPMVGIDHEKSEALRLSLGIEAAAVPIAENNAQRMIRVRLAQNRLPLGQRNVPGYLQDDVEGSGTTLGIGILRPPLAFDWAMELKRSVFGRQFVSLTFEI